MSRPKDLATERGRIRHQTKEVRIIDAAMKVFADKGYHEAKISDIAREANVADGTIYLYFKNKDDLLLKVFESKLAHISAGLKEELSQISDARARLLHIIRYHLRLAIENPILASFITSELKRNAKNLNPEVKNHLDSYLSQWGKAIDDVKATNQFYEDLSTQVVQGILFGALDHASSNWINSGNRNPEELHLVETHLDRLVLTNVHSR